MNHYQLLCKPENQSIYKALLEANHLNIDYTSKYVLCESGVNCHCDYDFLIYFQKDKFTELIDFLKGHSKNIPTMIMGIKDGNYVPLEIENIVLFNSYGNDTYANTLNQTYKIKYKLYQLEEEILDNKFIRINKSEIVNIKHITKIIPMFKGKLILKLDGHSQAVDISRNYLKDFKERIGI